MKRLRVALTALLVGAFMLLSPSSAFAESVFTTVTCADDQGNEQSFNIGWDNTNQFFEGKGEIPRLFCEGGYAGAYTVYVSDLLALDDPRRWFNGVAPTPTPSPEPTPEPVIPTPVPTQSLEPEPVPSVEPEPVVSVEPTLNPEPTPIPEPVQTPTPEPTQDPAPLDTPAPEPSPIVEASQEPTPEVTASPEPSVTPSPEPTPTPTTEVPEVAPVPVVEPVLDVTQVVALEVPSVLASVPGVVAIFEAAEAFMNIGSDMTDEQREESQSVVVAAVIVGQLAMRKIK